MNCRKFGLFFIIKLNFLQQCRPDFFYPVVIRQFFVYKNSRRNKVSEFHYVYWRLDYLDCQKVLDWKPSPCLLTSFLHNYNIPTIRVPIDSFFLEQFWLNLSEIYLLALKSDRLNLQKERICGDRLFVPVLQTQFPSKNTPWIAYIKNSVSKQTSTFFNRFLFYNFADLVLCTVNMKGRKCQNVRSLMFLLKIQTHIFLNCQYFF